jgi:hypothetical protein
VEPRAFRELKNTSFEEFVSLLFEQPKDTIYLFDPELDATTLCTYYVQLFQHPEFLISTFSKQQLEDGFWTIMGPVHEWSASNLIDYREVPVASRKKCIESMAVLFERLFVNEPLDGSVHMWWDSFCYDWHCGNRKRERGGEDLELQDIFFDTLVRVLAIDSWICQGAALHGLGHLHHPNTAQAVDRFIGDHPSLTDEQVKYARAAAVFNVL